MRHAFFVSGGSVTRGDVLRSLLSRTFFSRKPCRTLPKPRPGQASSAHLRQPISSVEKRIERRNTEQGETKLRPDGGGDAAG